MSIGLQVRLNGTPIRGRIDGLDSFSVTYSRNESTGRTQKAFSNELTFYDDGFNLIFNQLVASPTGLTKYIKVQIWDECCNDFIYQDLIIRGSMVKYCTGDCYVECTMVREDPDERIYDCFDRTPITTDLENPDGSFNPNHWLVSPNSTIAIPQVPYCNEMRPASIWYVLLTIVLVIFFLLGILNNIINLIIGNNNNPLNGLMNFIGQNVSGCGRKHPSPYIYNYIGEATKYCRCDQNTPFISSFLTNVNSPYHSTLFINAPIRPGIDVNNNTTRYIVENRPRQTITEFLDMVASDFNALWWVENGRVYMERKDYFLSAPVLYDAIVNQKTGNILKGACFTYNEGTVYASQRIQAQEDGTEKTGNSLLRYYGVFLDYIKIYGQPQGSEAWKDVKEVQLSYAPTGFRREDSLLDRYPFIGPLQTAFPSIGQFQGVAVFQDNEFLIHKYFEADPTTPDNFKKARQGLISYYNFNTNSFYSVPGGSFNSIYWVNEQSIFSQNPNKPPNIYNDFHAIDDPINNPWRFWDYELEVKMDCQLIKQLTVNKSVRLQTPYGTTVQAKINTIVANYGERIITITGQF
jgi:hypothetical protein